MSDVTTDNRGPRETNLVVNVDPADLFKNALENQNDYGAFPYLYDVIINALIEYSGDAVEAEDPPVLNDRDGRKRLQDFILYLQMTRKI